MSDLYTPDVPIQSDVPIEQSGASDSRDASNSTSGLTAPFRRIALTTVALGASGATTLIFNVVLARTLAPSAYGGIARTYALSMSIAQLTMSSIAQTLARGVAHGDSQHHRQQLARYAIGLLSAITVAVSFLYYPLAILGLAPSDPLSIILGISLAAIYATYFGLKSILFSLDWIKTYAQLELTSDAIFVVTLFTLALIAPATTIATFSIAYAFFIIRCIGILRRGVVSARLPVDRHFLGYSTFAFIGTYTSVVRFPLAVSLTGLASSSYQSARIAAIIALIMPLFLLPQAVSMLTFAQVARARGADESRSIRTTVRFVGGVAGVVSLISTIVAQPIIHIILGPKYVSMTNSFLIIVLCLSPQLAAMPVGNAMAAEKGVALKAALALVGLVIAGAGVLLLAPRMGAEGAAYAIAASALLTGVCSLCFGHVYYKLRLVADLREAWLFTAAALCVFISGWHL
jgi:O-antigen/teichoic acid export membrane protein